VAINAVQFQKGLSMAEFQERYGSEAQCEQALKDSRWPQGFVCPACTGTCSRSFRRGDLQYWECLSCSHQCSLISGTIFEATKLDLTRWFLAMHLLTQAKNGVSALELKRHIGVCYKTALLLKHKVMEVMRLREVPRQLTGRVEVDDAYLGGERPGGKPGRGSENKVPFVAAVQTTESGQPVLCCLTPMPFTTAAVEKFAAKSLARPVTVVSDGLGCFAVLADLGMVHHRVVTGGGSASVKLPQFTAVNTLLGNLKTTIKGTYHAFDFAKYAHRYLGAVQYLFNRRFDLRAILPRLLFAAASTPPRPRRVLCLGLLS
jgi:ribosomal protein L37AE/L43A